MAEINNVSDLLRLLREQPDLADQMRAILLTREFLQIPITVSSFAEALSTMSDSMATMAESLTVMSKPVTTMNERVSGLTGAVQAAGGRIDRLEAELAEVKATLDRQNERLSQLMGSDYESYAADVVPRRLRSIPGLTGARLFSQRRKYNSPGLNEIATSAFYADRITEAEADEMGQAVLVFEVTIAGTESYVLAEVSMTVRSEDVTRARARAVILEKASGMRTIPAVVGAAIEEAAQAEASPDDGSAPAVTFIPLEPLPA